MSEEDHSNEPHIDFEQTHAHKKKSDFYYSQMTIILKLTLLAALVLFYLKVVKLVELKYYHGGLIILVGSLISYILSLLWISSRFKLFKGSTIYVPIAKVMLYVLTSSCLTLPPLTFFLVMLRMDELTDVSYILLLLPLMVAQITSLLFISFILPALIDDDSGHGPQIRWAVVLLAYYFALWSVEIAFLVTISRDFKYKYLWVVSPLLLALFIHQVSNFMDISNSSKPQYGPPSYPPQQISTNRMWWSAIELLILTYTLTAFSIWLQLEDDPLFYQTTLVFAPLAAMILINIIIQLFKA